MTVKRDPDTILAAWLEEGPTRLPDATRRAITVTTRTTRQSRRPPWVPWRFPNMNGMTRFALAAAAVVAVALGGLYLINPSGGTVGGPGPSATPTASPTPTPIPFPTDTSGGVPVNPGRLRAGPSGARWCDRRGHHAPDHLHDAGRLGEEPDPDHALARRRPPSHRLLCRRQSHRRPVRQRRQGYRASIGVDGRRPGDRTPTAAWPRPHPPRPT